MSQRTLFATILVGALLMPTLAFAQAGGGGGGGGGGGRNFDPAAMRQRMLDNIKTQLGSSEDEWKVLSPKIEKVLTAQRDTRAGGGFGRGGRGGNNAPAADASAVVKAQAELRAAVDNKSTPADELVKKLAAFRDARDKAKAALAAVQKDLKDVLTPAQEAMMVSMGILE